MADSERILTPAATGHKFIESSGLAAQSKRLPAMLVSRSASIPPTITYADVAEHIGIQVCNLKHPMNHLSRILESHAAS